MRSAVRKFVVCLLCLWFPLQGVAGVVMPFCSAGSHESDRHAHPDRHGHAADRHDSAGGHEHCAETAQAPAAASTLPADVACDQCSMCHLACAAVLPTPALTLASPETPVVDGRTMQHVPSRFPDATFRPPRPRAT